MWSIHEKYEYDQRTFSRTVNLKTETEGWRDMNQIKQSSASEVLFTSWDKATLLFIFFEIESKIKINI